MIDKVGIDIDDIQKAGFTGKDYEGVKGLVDSGVDLSNVLLLIAKTENERTLMIQSFERVCLDLFLYDSKKVSLFIFLIMCLIIFMLN